MFILTQNSVFTVFGPLPGGFSFPTIAYVSLCTAMKQEMKTVLVADDQPMNQKVFSMILEKLGYDSIIAYDGEEALEKALHNEPDLVFMDIQMPKMNGYEASKNLRDRGFKKPIIAVTAGDPIDEKENCLDAGVDDVIAKPVNRSDIEKILEKWVHAGNKTPDDSVRIFTESVKIPVSASVVFDIAGMLESFMHDEKAALPFLSRFIERTDLQLKNIPALKGAEDWESARRDAHTIRGAAYTMGGTELGYAAATLELACKNASREETEIAYPLVLNAFLRFRKEAEAFILSRS